MDQDKLSAPAVAFLTGKAQWETLSSAEKTEAMPFVRDAALQIFRVEKGKRKVMLGRMPEGPRGLCRDIIAGLPYEMEERAAIREYDARMARQEAERLTRADYGIL